MNTLFYTLRRGKRLFHAFLVEGAWGCLRDVKVAYGVVADFDLLGTVFYRGRDGWQLFCLVNRNIPLDIIRNENIIELDNILRSDSIIWNWQKL